MINSVILQKNPAMVTRMIDGEAVIMDPQKGKVLALNEVGSFIWDRINGIHTEEDIVDAVCKEFKVSKEEALTDLKEFVEVLKGKNVFTVD